MEMVRICWSILGCGACIALELPRQIPRRVRGLRVGCLADFTDNCPDASRLLRQLLCDIRWCCVRCFPATARTLRGSCPATARVIRRTLRGCEPAVVIVADWSWTGCGCGHRVGHSPASARTLFVHCSDAGQTTPGYGPDSSPEDARIIRRTIRRTSCRMLRGHCAACSLTFM